MNKIGNEVINKTLIREILENLNLVYDFYNFAKNLFIEDYLFCNSQLILNSIEVILKTFMMFTVL